MPTLNEIEKELEVISRNLRLDESLLNNPALLTHFVEITSCLRHILQAMHDLERKRIQSYDVRTEP